MVSNVSNQHDNNFGQSMLLKGFSDQLIREITHLSDAELNNLKKKIRH